MMTVTVICLTFGEKRCLPARLVLIKLYLPTMKITPHWQAGGCYNVQLRVKPSTKGKQMIYCLPQQTNNNCDLLQQNPEQVAWDYFEI